MLENKDFETLSQATNALVKAGFNENFKAEDHKIISYTSKKEFLPSELQIVHTFRFEGMSNPQDDCVAFALKATDGTKGTLVMSHSSKHSQNIELIKKIPNAEN